MSNAFNINYSYEGLPTLRDFARSDARIRGIKGPFGCVSAETEFLTQAGWRRMDQYVPGDTVAQWQPSGHIQFVEPVAYINEPCSELIEFDSGSLMMRLSPEHRIPHYNWAGIFSIKTGLEMEARPSKSTIPTTFAGPQDDGLGMSDALIRFAVMMHADGCYPKAGHKAVISVRKDRKKVRIRQLLDALGVAFTESVYDGRPTEAVFRFVPPYKGKRFDGKWWLASQRELSVVLDEVQYWDGLFEGPDCRYISNFKEDVDFLQYAAHANGLRASICMQTYGAKPWKPTYVLHIRTGDNQRNRAMVRRDTTRINRVPTTDGRKYCFTVPSGFFIARCDDTIFVTGNSGKSSASVVELVRRAQMHPRSPDGVRHSRWGIVRNTYSELRSTTIKTVFQWMPPVYFGKYVEQKHTYSVKAFPGVDMELLFLALDRPDDVSKLLSLELTGGWVNEAREVPWAIIEALDGRIARYPQRQDVGNYWSGIWMDTNPPDTDSAWYRFFEEKKWMADFEKLKREGALPPTMRPEEYAAIFSQPSGTASNAENLPNLEPGYYQKLGIGKSDEWKKIYVHGQYGFLLEGKLVYPEYNDRVHCHPVDPIPGIPIIRSYDFGLTPACAFSQVLPDGRWLTFDEMTSDNMSIDQFSDEVLSHCQRGFRGSDVRFEDYGDPAGEQRAQTDKRTCFEIMRSKGIDVIGSIQDPTLRQESVRRPLRTLVGGEPQFILHPRCKMLRKGFMGGYHRRRMQTSGPERYTDAPEKNIFSHVHDALAYGSVQYFGASLTGQYEQSDDFGLHHDYAVEASRDETTGY